MNAKILQIFPTVSFEFMYWHMYWLSGVGFGWVVLKCVVPRLPHDISSPATSQIFALAPRILGKVLVGTTGRYV